jgi:ABC-type Co2+ transport system permease subunit
VYDNNLMKRIAMGVAAGLAGTVALQLIRTQTAAVLPETVPPMRDEPGKFMVEQVKQALPEQTSEQLSPDAEATAAKLLAVGYGLTAGAIYAAFRADDAQVLADGIAVGAGAWAVGYLGWLPGLELMPPVQQQEPQQIVMPVVQHIAFGMITAAVYRLLQRFM